MDAPKKQRKSGGHGYFGQGISGYTQYKQTFDRLAEQSGPARMGTKSAAQKEQQQDHEQAEWLDRFQRSAFETNFNHTRWLVGAILLAVAMILSLFAR